MYVDRLALSFSFPHDCWPDQGLLMLMDHGCRRTGAAAMAMELTPRRAGDDALAGTNARCASH